VERDPVLALMKFGTAENMADLLLHGHLFMQSVGFFRSLEADAARGDQHEGLTYCRQANDTVLQVKQRGKWLKVEGIEGPMLFRDGGAEIGNIYSMFAFRGSHAEAFFDGRSKWPVDVDNLCFGDSAVVFTDGDEFMRRVRAAAEREGLELRYDLVEYVDRATYTGPVGPFRKFSAFAHQSEFRILTKPECETARVLTVGSLEDIAMTCPLVELNQRLRLQEGGEPV